MPARKKQTAAWKVSIHKNSDGIGGTWSAWLDLPNGYSATTYTPSGTRREAERSARRFRDGMKKAIRVASRGKGRE
jgi:hypothetical protein